MTPKKRTLSDHGVPYSTQLAGAIWRVKRREEAVMRLAGSSLRMGDAPLHALENYVSSLALATKEVREARRELSALKRRHL